MNTVEYTTFKHLILLHLLKSHVFKILKKCLRSASVRAYPRSTGPRAPSRDLKKWLYRAPVEKMKNRLAELPERERRVLTYHFGFVALECKTISEKAAYYHLTEKYISEIEAGALAVLRAGMNDGKIL